MNKRFTTKMLAEICGVSLGTVDRALNNKYGISPKTRDRILAVAEENGYTPNRIGRSLQSGKTFDIGVIIHDLDNQFFSQLVNAVQQEAWSHGYYIQLAVSLREPERERMILEHMVQRNVDGIILFPTGKGESLEEYIQSITQPVVTIANEIVPGSRSAFIGLKDRELLYRASKKILTKGYELLLYVVPFLKTTLGDNNYAPEERFLGLKDAAEECGIPYEILDDWDYLRRISKYLDMGKRVAVATVSDIYALEIIDSMKSNSYSIPDDIGILGFDDIDFLKYVSPSLSTIHYPVHEMGLQAFQLLKNIIDGNVEAEKRVILDADIIWRESI